MCWDWPTGGSAPTSKTDRRSGPRERLLLKLRPVRPGDEREYAGVITSIHGDEGVDPAVLQARWQREKRLPQNQGRYLILEGGQTCGYAFWTRPADWAAGPVKAANVNVRMIPSRQSAQDFAWILTQMETAAKSSGADVALAVAREEDDFHPGALAACGYRVDRLSRSWRLNLSDRTAELLLARSSARKDMARIGIEIRSLDDTADESIWRELYGLAAETIPDIPSTFSEAIPSFEIWLARMHEPGVFVDRIWTAWRDDSLVAYTYLVYRAAGDVSTAYTGTRKQFRGLGIARAVKLESIGQAIELGKHSITTNNDLENAAILHINSTLGYQPLPGLVTYVKSLTS